MDLKRLGHLLIIDSLFQSRVVITNIYGPDHPLVTGLKTPYKYCEGAYADYLEQMEENEESEENGGGGGGEEAADGDGYFTSKPISWKWYVWTTVSFYLLLLAINVVLCRFLIVC